MARKPLRIFLSSTSRDLAKHREAVSVALEQLHQVPVRMETFTALPDDPATECRRLAAGSDLVVCIVANEYGHVPPTSSGGDGYRSITWLELAAATEAPKPVPVLAFLAEIDSSEAGSPLRAFKQFLGKFTWRSFNNPDHLAKEVCVAVINHLGGHQTDDEHPDLTPYLTQLRDRCGFIEIQGLMVASGKAPRLPIDHLYIPLNTRARASSPSAGRGSAQTPDGETDLVELKTLLDARPVVNLIFIGDPGSGKSTFLRKSVLDRVHAFDADPLHAPFPILASLARLAAFMEAHKPTEHEATGPTCLADFLAAESDEFNQGLSRAFFQARFQDQHNIVFLDGLDEGPTARSRELLSALIENAARAYPKTSFVVTTRPASYEGSGVLRRFDDHVIEPLDRPAILFFLQRWCQVLYSDSEELAGRYLAELTKALRAVPEIRRMASNPLMLTALAVVHWCERNLPEQRADLYRSILNALASSRVQRPGRIGAAQCLTRLQKLARKMHLDPAGRKLEIERAAAARELAPDFGASGDAALEFIRQEELETGIIVSRGPTVVFKHLTFQEFLVARALGFNRGWIDTDLFDKDARVFSPNWREVLLLLLGNLSEGGMEPVDEIVSKILDRVGPGADLKRKAMVFGLLGAVMVDLRPRNKPYGYHPADKRYLRLRDEVLAIFDRDKCGGIDFATRLAAANALGESGDPRLNEDNWIRVEPGSVWMGEAEERVKRKEVAIVKGFDIAKYPVTVAEFAQFVDSGGYDDLQWWDGTRDLIVGKRDEPWYPRADRRNPAISRESIAEHRDEPWGWEQQTEKRNHPVSGVSWYEAKAYCRWRTEQERAAPNHLREPIVIRLLSEAEWEFVARGGGEDRPYPWGTHENSHEMRANYFDGERVRGTTPVGLHPHGATPEGVLDMAGNVWEWVEDAEAGEDNEALRVLRGGSFDDYAWHLCCGARWVFRPGFSSNYLGLRVAREV